MYIDPGQGRTTPWGQNFDVNRNILSLRSFVASLKKISVMSDFIHFFFHDLIHIYSPGAGTDSPPPPGDNILMSTERPYHFTLMLQIAKKSL